ncbi:MAG: MgtC/SapB family protein [Candidatus Aenigmatarchaeota archaeon]|nr:MgtC/SapB family protein [Candidatus Aenigmarchaeota archaeon]
MQFEILAIIKLLLAAFLGGIVGFEREKIHRPAGFRTHMIVSLSSCLITIVSMNVANSDPLRLAANIITGIGFIGAGTIIATSGKIVGLTTATTIFSVAGIGIAVGAGFYIVSIFATILLFVVLELKRFERNIQRF